MAAAVDGARYRYGELQGTGAEEEGNTGQSNTPALPCTAVFNVTGAPRSSNGLTLSTVSSSEMGCGSSVCGSDEPAPPRLSTPRLPLTAKERSRVVSSWNTIHRALEPIGVYMFVNLFQEHAELLDFFEKFGRLRSREAQAESLELAEHACIVMGALHHSVTALQEPARFCTTLHAIGGSHTRVPGFRKELFWKIRRPFLESVAVTLRGGYTMQTAQLYRSTIDLILRTVADGFQLAQRNQLHVCRDTSAINDIRDEQKLNRDKRSSQDLQHVVGTETEAKALDSGDF